MKALTFSTVCLLTTPAFSQDMGGMMAAQSAMDASNAAAASNAAMHQSQTSQQILLQLQAQQQAQLQAEHAKQRAQQVQDGQINLPNNNPTVTPAARPIQQNNQAVAPAVFYAPVSGEKVVSPTEIEVEVPVYSQFQPRVKAQQIVTEIKSSEFFLEVNPLRLTANGGDFESNNTSNAGPELEFDKTESKFKMMPLDFKFGFENQNWGGFAEVMISDGEDRSEAVIYTKIGPVKLGGGLTLSMSDDETKVKSQGVLVAKGESDSSEIGPYFFSAFEVVNNDSVVIEQWNKIGGVFEKEEVNGTTTFKGVSFLFNPALDIMFKINPKLLIGIGAEFEYRRFSGDIKLSNYPSYKGIGNTYGFELNLIKTKFLF